MFQIFARDTWDLESELASDDLVAEELVGVTAWSRDGTFLAAGTTKGRILIWNAGTGKVAFSKATSRGYGISAMAWDCVKDAELAFIDSHGYWGVLEKFHLVVQSTLGAGKAPPAAAAVHIVDDKDEFNEEELAAMLFDNDDDDDDDNENSFNIRKIKAATTGFLDGDGAFGDDDSNVSKPDKKESAAPTPQPPPPVAVQPVEVQNVG